MEGAPPVDGNHVELRNLFVHLILNAIDVAADERSRYVDRVLAKPVSAAALLAPLGEIARSGARRST